MILLLGASGYIGEAFVTELQHRKMDFLPLARKQVNYTRFDALLEFLKTKKPAFVINAAGYTGKPNVDACELAKADTLLGNALLPQTIAPRLRGNWNSVGACFFRLCFFRGENHSERENTCGKRFDQAGTSSTGGQFARCNPRFCRNGHAEFFLSR